jgi:hypothetical protein
LEPNDLPIEARFKIRRRISFYGKLVEVDIFAGERKSLTFVLTPTPVLKGDVNSTMVECQRLGAIPGIAKITADPDNLPIFESLSPVDQEAVATLVHEYDLTFIQALETFSLAEQDLDVARAALESLDEGQPPAENPGIAKIKADPENLSIFESLSPEDQEAVATLMGEYDVMFFTALETFSMAEQDLDLARAVLEALS